MLGWARRQREARDIGKTPIADPRIPARVEIPDADAAVQRPSTPLAQEQHAPDDLDFFNQLDMGEAIHGVGVRSILQIIWNGDSLHLAVLSYLLVDLAGVSASWLQDARRAGHERFQITPPLQMEWSRASHHCSRVPKHLGPEAAGEVEPLASQRQAREVLASCSYSLHCFRLVSGLAHGNEADLRGRSVVLAPCFLWR
jgi:hypothetical protein